jgi:Flp pilus assembly protein TadD
MHAKLVRVDFTTRFRSIAIAMCLGGITLSGPACQSQTGSQPMQRISATFDTARSIQLGNEGLAALDAGETAQAVRLLEEARAADPRRVIVRTNLGVAYQMQNRFYEAAKEFEAASKLDPSAWEPRNNLGLLLERAGRIDEAIAEYEAARGIDPQQAEPLANVCRAQVARGDSTASLQNNLRELISLDSRPEWQSWARLQLIRLERSTTRPAS